MRGRRSRRVSAQLDDDFPESASQAGSAAAEDRRPGFRHRWHAVEAVGARGRGGGTHGAHLDSPSDSGSSYSDDDDDDDDEDTDSSGYSSSEVPQSRGLSRGIVRIARTLALQGPVLTKQARLGNTSSSSQQLVRFVRGSLPQPVARPRAAPAANPRPAQHPFAKASGPSRSKTAADTPETPATPAKGTRRPVRLVKSGSNNSAASHPTASAPAQAYRDAKAIRALRETNATLSTDMAALRGEVKQLYEMVTETNLKVNEMIGSVDRSAGQAEDARREAQRALDRADHVEAVARQARSARCSCTVTATDGLVALTSLPTDSEDGGAGDQVEADEAFAAARGETLVLLGDPAGLGRRHASEIWQQAVRIDPYTQKKSMGWALLRAGTKRLVGPFRSVG